MPGVYGVTAADVAAEMPTLFPSGFTPHTTPSLAVVEAWITRADFLVSQLVLRVTGTAALPGDAAAVLAEQYVIDFTKARVMRAMYEGAAPESVNAAAAPYFASASEMLKALEAMGTQASGAADEGAAPRVLGSIPDADRTLTVTDAELAAYPDRVRRY